jgi:hypothetical protein
MKLILENWRNYQADSGLKDAIEILSEIAYAPEAALLPEDLQMRIMNFLQENGAPTIHEE